MKLLRDNWLPLTAIAAMVGISVYAWGRLPDSLPVHWDALGEVDRYGSRFEALGIMPLVALMLFLVPRLSTPSQGAQAPNAHLRRLIMDIVLLGLAPLHVGIVANLLGAELSVPRLAGLAVGLILLFTGNLLPKAQPSLWLGVRTPWTLGSRASWQKVNRAGGWLLVGAGVAFLVGSLLTPSPVALFLVVGLTVLGVLGLVLYSYLVWRDDPSKGPLV